MSNKTLLMILDGWGIGNNNTSNAIHVAQTPNMDKFQKEYPNSQLGTCGEQVGLPAGQMGNSEVGHLNIGAGRVVYQDLVKINKAIKDNTLIDNKILTDALNHAKENNVSVHFLGLVSNGGVHSQNKHLYELCKIASQYKNDNIYIHALTDGRDTDPKSGLGYIKELNQEIVDLPVKIASLTGRYYTMDRDNRWERIKKGYDVLVHGIGHKTQNIEKAIQYSYNNNVTDEFIEPHIVVDEQENPIATIKENDVVICFNFRTDRLREISIALTQKDMPEHGMKTLPLYYATMTRYDEEFKNIKVLFDKENVKNTIGETIAKNNLSQLRIAETEKYAHVTFFFSGGREEPFKNENRVLIPSPKVATYDLQPEMSAPLVKDAVIKEIKENTPDFICLNFANGDMVGHTGIFNAIIKGVEAVDSCVGEVVEEARKKDYNIMIIADHGNADNAVNIDKSPNTAHSLNPVPCIVISEKVKKVKPGILADVAPTILDLMNIEIPKEMTGNILIEK